MKLAGLITALFLAGAAPASAQVGWQALTAGGSGEPLTVQVWYPSAAKAQSHAFGPFTQQAAKDGPVRGGGLPLVILSHGSGGSAFHHHDTARALAEAGFVVAAPNHAGDTAGDMRFSGGPRAFAERARQVTRVVDHMLGEWPQRGALDPQRIGMFGHSAGGTTALIIAGGEPDFIRFRTHCTTNPQAQDCRFVQAMRAERARNAQAGGVPPVPPTPLAALSWTHDPRIKAVVAAAPALGYVFEGGGLKAVATPVQLWTGDKDEVTPAVWNADVIRRSLPKPPEFALVAGAGHPVFLAACPEGFAAQAPDVCSDPAGFRRTAFHPRFNEAVVKFFRRTLTAD